MISILMGMVDENNNNINNINDIKNGIIYNDIYNEKKSYS